MRTIIGSIVLGLAGVAGASLPTRESPRATDLLRAEKNAEQAQRLLKPPQHSGPVWRHGGSGWKPARDAAPAEPGNVTIKVAPARRPRER